MENKVEVFEHEVFGKLDVVIYKDKPMFYANEVAESLGYSNIRNAKNKCKSLISLNMSETDMLGLKSNGNHGNVLAGESDFYRMVMGSKLPFADKFQDWVVEDVLPSIRKHGGYLSGQEEMSPEELMAKAVLLANSQIEELKGKVENQAGIISDKNFPVSLTKMFSGNNKVAQAANLYMEDKGWIEKSFEKGVKKGWRLTEDGEKVSYGVQHGKHSIFWTPSILKLLPSQAELLRFAERMDLINWRKV